MKLRNKKTGEIVELDHFSMHYSYHYDYGEDARGEQPCSTWNQSLAELNEEWEDYEEPKEHWCVTMYGGITRIKDDEEPIDDLIEIGNYFNSKEDAYDAWDKLRAWKRLRDKGFRFTGIGKTIYDMDCAEFDIGSEYLRERDLRGSELNKDLDLLFGGKE